MGSRVFLRVFCTAIALAASTHPLSARAQTPAPQQPVGTPPVPAQPAQPAPAATTPVAQQAEPTSASVPQAAPAAAPVQSAPTASERKRARDSYAEGQASFAAGRYDDALAAFRRAFANIRNPIVRLPIAECLTQLGRFEDARSELTEYLSERADAPDRAAVEAKLAALDVMPATLVLSSTPAGARVMLDGEDTARVTPAEIEIARGDHTLELLLDGHEPVTERLSVHIGERAELSVALTPAAPPPVVAADAIAVPAASGAQAPDLQVDTEVEPPTTALWVTSIVGAAGLVGGTVLGFMALAERSDFDANPTEASADRGERLALFADVSFGVGAMAIITGAVLYLTADESGGDREPAGEQGAPSATEAANLRLAPAIARDGAGISARISF